MFSKKQIKEIKNLKKVYAVCLALSDTLSEKAKQIEQNILDNNNFYDNDGNILKNPEEVYTLCDKDFERFFLLRKLEMRKAGLGHPQDEEGVSVDAVASNNVVKIKKRIFEFVIKTLPKEQAEIFEKSPFRIVNGESVFNQVINLFLNLAV